MGLGRDPYEVAEAFYSSWSGFVSELSFGWVDEYNVNEVRRAAEQAEQVDFFFNPWMTVAHFVRVFNYILLGQSCILYIFVSAQSKAVQPWVWSIDA